jgi:translation initiation factor 5
MELGTQTKFDEAADRAVVQGAHNAPDLQKSLEKFIEQFVLCPTCKLPEIKMKVKSSIKIDCAACGYNGALATTHKLTQFILKNPPTQKAAKAAGGAHEAAAAAAGANPVSAVEDVDAKADEAAEQVEKAAANRKKGVKDDAATAPEEVKWFTDTSDDAVKLRKEKVGTLFFFFCPSVFV